MNEKLFYLLVTNINSFYKLKDEFKNELIIFTIINQDYTKQYNLLSLV